MAKKSKNWLFQNTARKSRAEVSEFIQQFGQKIGQGQIVLRQTPEDLIIQMPQQMDLMVKVNEKIIPAIGRKRKRTLQLTWYDSDQQEDPLALGS